MPQSAKASNSESGKIRNPKKQTGSLSRLFLQHTPSCRQRQGGYYKYIATNGNNDIQPNALSRLRRARAGAIALHACFRNCGSADVSEKKASGSQGYGSRCGSCIRSLLAVVGNSSQNCRHAQKDAQTVISDRVNQSGKHEHVFIFFSKSGHKMKRLHPVIVQSALP
jgi:bacterioferritin-associated ferredoxin